MNYLAHFHLAYGDDNLIIGGLLGDFVKGPLTGQRPAPIEQGILLHRKIDAYTDSHALLKQCQSLFDSRYRRYAGIMTDVAFDHFLSRNWQQFHRQSLEHFSAEIFRLLRSNKELPDRAQTLIERLEHYNVFYAYQNWDTVEAALSRISGRLKAANPLPDSGTEMRRHYNELENCFLEFYPQLQHYVLAQRAIFAQ